MDRGEGDSSEGGGGGGECAARTRLCLENEAQGANQCEWKWTTLGRPIASYTRPSGRRAVGSE